MTAKFFIEGVPAGYLYNPHSQTCIRKVDISMNHTEAKRYCESYDERLANFKTEESFQWLLGLHSKGRVKRGLYSIILFLKKYWSAPTKKTMVDRAL